MYTSLSFRRHVATVAALYRAYGLYLINLDFCLLLVGGLSGGALLLAYFATFPILITGIIALIFLIAVTIATFGVAKNMTALARDRGPSKYPLFIRDYFLLGLPFILLDELAHILPYILATLSGLYVITHSLSWWWLVPILMIYYLWQLFFGLSSAVYLDRGATLRETLADSLAIFTHCRRELMAITSVDVLLLALSHLLPVVGAILVNNWLVLSHALTVCEVRLLLNRRVKQRRQNARQEVVYSGS